MPRQIAASKIIPGPIDRETALRLIWARTHKDYRGTTNGEKTVLVLRSGGTQTAPLSGLTDEEIAYKLPIGFTLR